MKKLLLLSVFLSATLFIPITPVTAASKKPKKPTPVPVSTTDKISAVHLTSITVSIHSPASSKEFKVTPATQISVNGKPAALRDLATGMDVNVTTAADPTTAAMIDAKSSKK